MRQAVGENCPWQAIASSPLSRCADFARELAARHGLPLEIDARLIELGFGAWEGCTAQELTAKDPEILARFRSDPLSNTPPGAESLAVFRSRILEARDILHACHSMPASAASVLKKSAIICPRHCCSMPGVCNAVEV